MANIFNDIGNAMVTACRNSIAELNGVLANSGADLHVEYGLRPASYGYAQGLGDAIVEPGPVNARTVLPNSKQLRVEYLLRIKIKDAGGRQNFIQDAQQGVMEALGDDGVTLFRTHLTDNGSNLRNKSGRVTLGPPTIDTQDDDNWVLEFPVDVICTVKGTLS